VGFFFGLPSILAIIFGGLAISQIRKNPGTKGQGMAVAGLVLGILAIVIWTISIIIIVISLRGIVY
jgi:predicted acyltransferase